MNDLPSLAALRAFEAAARLLSFRAAAEELSVTQSAISHQVAELERRLGGGMRRILGWHRARQRIGPAQVAQACRTPQHAPGLCSPSPATYGCATADEATMPASSR